MGKKVMTKNIVVVGGGTAGWLTALMAKKSYPKLNIILIESEDIGILGAGEGSVPTLIQFFRHLEITIPDLVKNCDATIKNGIKFTNWNNDNESYYHGFPPTEQELGPQAVSTRFLSASPLQAASLHLNSSLKEIDFSEKISDQNKVPFIFKKALGENPVKDYENIGAFSIHFNATKLANRLKEIGIERGIKVIDGIVEEVSLDKEKYIKSLILKSKEEILCDFVFDCSGFHRLIIGKVFNSKWKSYSDLLPCDSAVPFFTEMTDEIPPYTEAIAMKYGWMWKIPLQNRFGCGYVYDSSLISEKEAIKEIEEFLGYEPLYPRKDRGGFKFSAGSYEETWINNCVAIGLAGNFVEPLEATSIWVSMVGLIHIFGNTNWITNNSVSVRDEFNKKIVSMNNDIVEFLYFHYLSMRKDTEFWQKFSYENAPEKLKEKINLWQHRMPDNQDTGDYWDVNSWILIGSAQETINKTFGTTYVQNSEEYEAGLNGYENFVNYQKDQSYRCMDHNKFLEYLK
jgi:tryptophan halogenase